MRWSILEQYMRMLPLFVVLGTSACSPPDEPVDGAPSDVTLDGGADGGADGATTSPDGSGSAPPGSCDLTSVSGAAPVAVTFKNLAPPSVVPPTMTGGALSGRFKATTATAFLPKETAKMIDPTKSKGTVTGWFVFEKDAYRMRLAMDFTIATPIGDQVQKTDIDSQGTFTTSGPSLDFSSVCDADAGVQKQPEYTFTIGPSGLTILVKTVAEPLKYDTYVQIDAVAD